jgi:hypothetical protein
MTQTNNETIKIEFLDIVDRHSPIRYECMCKHMSEHLMTIVDKVKMDDDIFDSLVSTFCELRKTRYNNKLYNCAKLPHNIQLMKHIV